MHIHVSLVLWLLTVHLVADFFAQTDWMAINKSKRLDALLVHVGWYSIIMAFSVFSWKFGLVTFVAHFITDFVTSRISRRQFPFVPSNRAGRLVDMEGAMNYANPLFGQPLRHSRHWFFCTIGVDQWLHAVQLILTASWLLY